MREAELLPLLREVGGELRKSVDASREGGAPSCPRGGPSSEEKAGLPPGMAPWSLPWPELVLARGRDH